MNLSFWKLFCLNSGFSLNKCDGCIAMYAIGISFATYRFTVSTRDFKSSIEINWLLYITTWVARRKADIGSRRFPKGRISLFENGFRQFMHTISTSRLTCHVWNPSSSIARMFWEVVVSPTLTSRFRKILFPATMRLEPMPTRQPGTFQWYWCRSSLPYPRDNISGVCFLLMHSFAIYSKGVFPFPPVAMFPLKSLQPTQVRGVVILDQRHGHVKNTRQDRQMVEGESLRRGNSFTSRQYSSCWCCFCRQKVTSFAVPTR